MKDKKRFAPASIVTMLALLFTLSTSAIAQNGWTITGRIADEHGSAVRDAEARLRLPRWRPAFRVNE